jgi:urea transport system substrate-binding protein
LSTLDGGQEPRRVAQELELLATEHLVDCVIGMHDSDVRTSLLKITTDKIPYFYTPTYEGGEHKAGLFCLGETPEQIVSLPIPWLAAERAIHNWHFIGNDYRWSRALKDAVAQTIAQCGGMLSGSDLLPFDHLDFQPVLDEIAEKHVQGVFVSLVGSSSVAFNRQFAARNHDKKIVRFDPLIETNTQLAIGPRFENGLMTASAYLASSPNAQNVNFRKAYDRRFGENAPEISSLAAGCYDGMHFFEALANKAQSIDIGDLIRASEGLEFEGVRGKVRMEAGHLSQSIHLIAFKAGREVSLTTFLDASPN